MQEGIWKQKELMGSPEGKHTPANLAGLGNSLVAYSKTFRIRLNKKCLSTRKSLFKAILPQGQRIAVSAQRFSPMFYVH